MQLHLALFAGNYPVKDTMLSLGVVGLRAELCETRHLPAGVTVVGVGGEGVEARAGGHVATEGWGICEGPPSSSTKHS